MPIKVHVNGKMTVTPPLAPSRSEAVQELLSRKPGFLVRWGITIFFGVLLCLGFVCWMIQYPDVVSARARLTSINAPKAVPVKINGKLVKLNVSEGDYVQAGSVIGFIESTAQHEEVMKLSTALESINGVVSRNREDLLPTGIQFLTPGSGSLGELQQAAQSFMQNYITYRSFLAGGFYPKKRSMLALDLANLQKQRSNLQEQLSIQQQDLALAQKNFDANKQLNREKYLSDLEYRNEESKLLGKRLSLPQLNSAIISNESQRIEKQKEILELESKTAEQRTVFLQALHTFQSHVEDWKKKYVLTAPVNGKVSFAGFFQENQQLRADQVICFVNPENSQYYAEMFIPQNNFGKVSAGQTVLLKFPAYPSHEFGYVRGRLEFISRMQADSGYLAKVILPNGLQTDHQKQLQFHDGLIAEAEIITENKRLLERFYSSITKSLQR
ncbi:MAG TPA: HlyD family efflux transporter periplasmic adaptor subunit [Flavisolibacter sp.]|jgi:HlyD family secretion protein